MKAFHIVLGLFGVAVWVGFILMLASTIQTHSFASWLFYGGATLLGSLLIARLTWEFR